jgi:UDP-N-acetylglucosamine--N-acetylmuramyl-(pentapeptide) pyrophosphoryl-undecaprenol N-acetylglucosamine transferase
MRAVFAGGGSAGHLSPSVAIAQRFLRLAPDPEVLFFGARRELDRAILAPYAHRLLPATGLPYGLSWRTVASLFRMAGAGMQALSALRRFDPQLFVGTGGYVTAASAPAAGMLKVPCLLHVSDALPDRTNLKLARMAHTITVAFEAAAAHFPADKVVVTGQPVREEFLQGDREGARAELGYGPEDLVFFVTGGSQGAQRLNDVTLGAAPKLLAQGLKILHQTGQADFARVRQLAMDGDMVGNGGPYRCLPFHPELGRLLAAADVILMRAGASSLAEAAAWGLPMVLVPYPYAHEHQKHNAQALVDRGAALMIEDASLTAETLTEAVLGLAGDAARREGMSRAASGWGSREAAERIARLALAAVG